VTNAERASATEPPRQGVALAVASRERADKESLSRSAASALEDAAYTQAGCDALGAVHRGLSCLRLPYPSKWRTPLNGICDPPATSIPPGPAGVKGSARAGQPRLDMICLIVLSTESTQHSALSLRPYSQRAVRVGQAREARRPALPHLMR
jgi:hypothetical protein